MVSSIFMEHLDDAERFASAIISGIEADSLLIESMENIIESKYEAMLKQCESKVMMESGTLEDLEMLYQEAEEEKKEAKKGFFATILEAIKTAWSNVCNWFNKNATDKLRNADTNGEGEVDEDDYKKASALKSGWESISGFVKCAVKLDTAGMKSHAEGAIKVLTTVGAVGTAAVVGVKLVKKNKEELKTFVEFLQNKAKDLLSNITNSTAFNAAKDIADAIGNNNIVQQALKGIQKLSNLVTKWGSKFLSAIMGVKDKITGKDKDNDNDGDNDNSIKGTYNRLVSEGKKKYAELKNNKDKNAQQKLKQVNNKYTKLQNSIYATFTDKKLDDATKLKNMEATASEVKTLLESYDLDYGEYAMIVLEAMHSICGVPYDEEFLELAMDPSCVPSDIYMEYALDDPFVADTLGMSTDTLSVYDEDAVEEDKKSIIEALEAL